MNLTALALAGVLFLWQFPHFMAIAWIYREDYDAVHFPMLPVRDRSGKSVARWSLINTFALIIVTAVPTFVGDATWIYLAGTAVLGLWFIGRAIKFLHEETRDLAAKKLFLASITWLPLQLGLLVVDRLFLL